MFTRKGCFSMSRDFKNTNKLIFSCLWRRRPPKENPNIVLNCVYKKLAIFKKGAPSRDAVREA